MQPNPVSLVSFLSVFLYLSTFPSSLASLPLPPLSRAPSRLSVQAGLPLYTRSRLQPLVAANSRPAGNDIRCHKSCGFALPADKPLNSATAFLGHQVPRRVSWPARSALRRRKLGGAAPLDVPRDRPRPPHPSTPLPAHHRRAVSGVDGSINRRQRGIHPSCHEAGQRGGPVDGVSGRPQQQDPDPQASRPHRECRRGWPRSRADSCTGGAATGRCLVKLLRKVGPWALRTAGRSVDFAAGGRGGDYFGHFERDD